MDGKMLYDVVYETVYEVFPMRCIDDVLIGKEIRTNSITTCGRISQITVLLYATNERFDGSCVSCVFNANEFPDRVTPGVKMRIRDTLQQQLNNFITAVIANERKPEDKDDVDSLIHQLCLERNLEWDDIHDVREVATRLAEMLIEERR